MRSSSEPASPSASLGVLAGTAFGVVMAHGGIDAARAQGTGDDATLLPTLPVQGTAEAGSSGYQVKEPVLGKLTSPVVDTPQSVIEVPQTLLQDEGVTTMRDALRNVPGVSLAAGEGGQQGDNLSIRGFNAQDDFYLDGMLDFGSYYRDPFNAQDIEVLEGPSSVLFGRGSSGGTIDQESKQPQMRAVTDSSIQIGTDQDYRFTADIDRALPGSAGAAVRLNVMANTNGIPGRDDSADRRFGLAPEFAIGLGTDTRFFLDYYHLQSYDTPDYGIPWLNGSPAPVSRSNYYGYADSDFFRSDVDIATAKLEHDFSDNLSVVDELRYGTYRRDLRVTEPQIDNQGSGTDWSTKPLSQIAITRSTIAVQSDETDFDDQLYGTWHAGHGFVHNTLVAGVELDRQTSDPTRYTYTKGTTSLLDPDSGDAFPYAASVSSVTHVVVKNVAPFATDTLSLGRYVDLIGGWRWDVVDTTYYSRSAAAVTNLSRDDELPSWRAAIVYKPTDYGSVYFDYGTSFDPSGEALSLSAATAVVAPEETTTYEVGTKWDVLHRKLSLAAALYQEEMSNVRETDPNDTTEDILAGDYRARGFQLTAIGHVTKRWELDTGFNYNDAIVVSSPYADEVGHQPTNAPRFTYNLFTTYAVPMPWHMNDLTVGGGVNYVSSRTASSTPLSGAGTVVERAPGYVTANLMLKYRLSKRFDVQLNVENVSNTYYYDELHPFHIIVGPARSAMLTVNAKL